MENEILNVLTNFLKDEWVMDEVYDARFFVDKYSNKYDSFREPRKVRYNLNQMVEMGLICRVKDDYNVYYIKTEWFNLFNEDFNGYEKCIW